jgi:hypothetical protein
MNPSYIYAALLDVLGYRQLLNRDLESGRLDFQEKLAEALRIFESVNEAVFRVQAISDTIILTCNEHQYFPEFLQILRSVFIAFLRQGVFVRGGVSYSRHFQSGRLTYSHAVARAYELESNLASYPRIVVDKNIIDMYATGKNLPNICSCNLLCVENGVHFLDVVTPSNWAEVYAYAKNIHDTSLQMLMSDESAFSKHIRFERYLLASPSAPIGATGFVGQIKTT